MVAVGECFLASSVTERNDALVQVQLLPGARKGRVHPPHVPLQEAGLRGSPRDVRRLEGAQAQFVDIAVIRQ